MPDLSKVAIGIKTFLRDGALFNTIQAIRDTVPEVQMIIADDGEMTEEKDGIYADLQREKHEIIILPFDSGFGAKSNAITLASKLPNKRPYLLIGSDDFDFRPSSVREGIEKMVDVLDNAPIDIAGGRVFGPYEFFLEEKSGVIREIPIRVDEKAWYNECDLTVNYCLIRSSILGFGSNQVHWDSDVRIGGGEHGAFFVDVKRVGYKVAYVPGVQISEQKNVSSQRYQGYRNRSANPARPCFVRRGITEYILGNGRHDYKA
jgi:hypothetical protein